MLWRRTGDGHVITGPPKARAFDVARSRSPTSPPPGLSYRRTVAGVAVGAAVVDGAAVTADRGRRERRLGRGRRYRGYRGLLRRRHGVVDRRQVGLAVGSGSRGTGTGRAELPFGVATSPDQMHVSVSSHQVWNIWHSPSPSGQPKTWTDASTPRSKSRGLSGSTSPRAKTGLSDLIMMLECLIANSLVL